ncbi:MAG: polysaccharide biosynthesis/export family protein [Muribaculaceae bacterium]|nr:polysaccharide biosynthesis/export family protein [Muribaculaceae bacterium]
MTKTNTILIASLLLFLAGCNRKALEYFPDVPTGASFAKPAEESVKVEPGNKLSILVSSRDPQLAYLFNLPVVSHYESSLGSMGNQKVAYYRVDEKGEIDFPILGKLQVNGLTRGEISQTIKNRLVSENLLNDAIVTVDFLNVYYSVAGEVKTPGRYSLDQEQTTILDALSRAGDMTIFGVRDNVLVLRNENNKQVVYRIDLTKPEEIYSSPAFYIRQNDMVYVSPNSKRAAESTNAGTTLRQPTFWLSAASLLTTILVLILK